MLQWNGVDDPYHLAMEPFAAANGYRYLATGGDHLGAMTVHALRGGRRVPRLPHVPLIALRP